MKNDYNLFRECWLGQRPTARHGECDRMEGQRLPGSSAAEMAPCFAPADLFFLLSREGPCPATVPEVMAYGLPGMGLAGSGLCCGSRFEWAWGVIVPYGDVRC